MNEPIISPWVFYWIDILSKFKDLPFVLFCGLFTLLVMILFYFIAFGPYDDEEKIVKKTFHLVITPYIIISILLCIAVAFIPSRTTMYQMLISSYVTPNNIEYIKSEVKGSAQGIVDSITDASIKIIKAKEGK